MSFQRDIGFGRSRIIVRINGDPLILHIERFDFVAGTVGTRGGVLVAVTF